jgi:hypothetical protein
MVIVIVIMLAWVATAMWLVLGALLDHLRCLMRDGAVDPTEKLGAPAVFDPSPNVRSLTPDDSRAVG